MSIQIMLWIVVVLFAIAAVGGLSMTSIRVFSISNLPTWLAMVHGLLAAAGRRDADCNGHAHHACSVDPQDEIESDTIDHVAVHEGDALNEFSKQV